LLRSEQQAKPNTIKGENENENENVATLPLLLHSEQRAWQNAVKMKVPMASLKPLR
jgi:hypothetical protein